MSLIPVTLLRCNLCEVECESWSYSRKHSPIDGEQRLKAHYAAAHKSRRDAIADWLDRTCVPAEREGLAIGGRE